ncbi:MAG: BamA/TamA family outer membrane protein [Bryobacteraceae bacterium]|nr:BamA/TamA family outer membrane protein [Bryobacteraceae bacterium]
MILSRSIVSLAFCVGALAQEPQPIPPDIQSRAELLERLRDQKKPQLKPAELSKTENTLNKIGDAQFLAKIEGQTGGFRPVIGGLQTGSGFAVGVAWRPPNLIRKPYAIRASGSISTRLWQAYELGVAFPRLWSDKLSLDFETAYRDLNSLSYFGPGPKSRGDNRTNFRREDTAFTGTLIVQPLKYFRFGAFGGYTFHNVGRGKDRRYASTDDQFVGQPIPGLGEQTDYLRTGFEAAIDWRDFPRGPRRGGLYSARYAWHNDRVFNRYDFSKLDLLATQYIPFFNDKRVFVLRAKTDLTYTNNGNVVPFYVQPVVGGSDDLRGFRPYRFYGDNSAVANAEYRWEVSSGLDMALFMDFGQVFERRKDFAFNKFESSWGFGFRGNVRNIPVIRVDVGFSREGFRIWFKFNNFM